MRSQINATLGSLAKAILKPLLCIAIPFLALAGDDFWNQKDFRHWSQKEVQKLLEDSPWSKKCYVNAESQSWGSVEPRTGRTQTYIVQLRSAKPIQHAIVRQIQIDPKYDTLPPLKNKVRDYLSVTNPDEVIAHISFSSNPPDVDFIRYWQTQSIGTLKDYVFLVVKKGVKIPIKRFVLKDDFPQLEQTGTIEFEFIFPRSFEGREILVAGDKMLKLQFIYPIGHAIVDFNQRNLNPRYSVVGGFSIDRIIVEFNAEKMKFQGKLTY